MVHAFPSSTAEAGATAIQAKPSSASATAPRTARGPIWKSRVIETREWSICLADQVVDALKCVPTLHPVPRQRRHITRTGMGHVHDVPDELRHASIDKVRYALHSVGPIHAALGHLSILQEAVALHTNDPEPFTELQNLIQQVTAEAVSGADASTPRFRAHVSTHCSNETAPAGRARLA